MIVCLDFASLYPSMMIAGNVFSPSNLSNGEVFWQGGGIYSSIYQNTHEGIRGKYSRKQGEIEKVLFELYKLRLASKKDPNKYLAIKILINTMYGIMGSPKFKSIYSLIGASDVTSMARRTILHARTILEEYGYEIIYTDTDSCYVKVKDNDLNKLNDIVNYIVTEQKKSMNILCEFHNFKLECIIKRMYFFRDDTGEFIKKHYIYVTENNEVVIKGIGIKRGNCSKISKLFFEEVIKKDIENNIYVPYTVEDLLYKLKSFTIGKEELLQKRYRVHSLDSYKVQDGKEEATGLMYLISKKYGAGEHWLIVNKRIGVGKGNHYATMNELKEKYGDHWIDQVCFDVYMRELSEFIYWKDRNKIEKQDRKRI